MKKLFPISLIVLGVIFAGAGVYTIYRGLDARDQVQGELIAQNITTPEDATIPNARVDDIPTARSMADQSGSAWFAAVARGRALPVSWLPTAMPMRRRPKSNPRNVRFMRDRRRR